MRLFKKICFGISIYILISCFFVHTLPLEWLEEYVIVSVVFTLITFNISAVLSDFIFDKKEGES
jgi:hypothetical protein